MTARSLLKVQALAFLTAAVLGINTNSIGATSSTTVEQRFGLWGSFGLGARSAVTLGQFGTVIGPRAWRPFYVRYEMIHFLQGELFGVLRLLLKPKWLVEGMAYALSEDPREPLAEPLESYRREFRKWFQTTDKSLLWEQASEI